MGAFAYLQLVLIDLAFQDNIGCGSSESGRPADAGRVTNTQAHAFLQLHILLLPLESALLCLWTPVNFWKDRGIIFRTEKTI